MKDVTQSVQNKVQGAIPKLIKALFSRVCVVSISILAQFVVLALGVYLFRERFGLVYVCFSAFSVAVVLVILNSRTNPAYQIAWLIPVLLFPVFGAVLYLILGGNRLPARAQKKMTAIFRWTNAKAQEDPQVRLSLEQSCPDAAIQSAYLTRYGGGALYRGTQTVYYASAEDCYESILQEVRRARHYIYVEYFIIAQGRMWDQLLAILQEKAAQGVDVRVIYDDFGSITRVPTGYAKRLEKLGIPAAVFNPFIPVMSARLNNRDHRKLLIIDGVAAFTGGLNLADEYINELPRFGHWKDNGLLVRGDAAWSMTMMFASMWEYLRGVPAAETPRPEALELPDDGYIQPYTDNPLDGESVGETVYHNLMGRARHHIWIMTPYLILDNETLTGLLAAAKSGVDVRIITPGVPDKWYVHAVTRSNYEALVMSGVRIFEYTPGFVHSKVFAVDGLYATVGTVNLDFRSLYLHFENGVWLYGASAIAQVEQDFLDTLPVCHEVTMAECLATPTLRRWGRAVLRTFAPMM